MPALLSQPQFAQNSSVAQALAAAPQAAIPPHAHQLAVDLQVQCGNLSSALQTVSSIVGVPKPHTHKAHGPLCEEALLTKLLSILPPDCCADSSV